MVLTVTASTGERTPEPGIEAALAAGMAGELDFPSVMRVFAGWPIVLPSTVDFNASDGRPTPVVVSGSGTEGPPLVVVFTSLDLVGQWAEKAPYNLVAAGAQLLRGVQPGVGVVINPGTTLTTELTPEGVPIIRDFPREIEAHAVPGRSLSPLEVALAEKAAGSGSIDDVFAQLRLAEVVVAGELSGVYSVASASVVVEGKPVVPVFTNEDFVKPNMEWAAETIRIPFAEVIAQAGDGVGFIINPASGIWFGVSASAVAALRG